MRFEFVIEKMPAYERPMLPLTKAWIRRVNRKALERLPAALEAAIPAQSAAA